MWGWWGLDLPIPIGVALPLLGGELGLMNGYSIKFSSNYPRIPFSRLFAAPTVLTNVSETKICKVFVGKVKFVGQVLLPGQAGCVKIRFYRWNFSSWNPWMYGDFSLNYLLFSSQTKTLMEQSSCCWDNTSRANLRSSKNLPGWFCFSRGNHGSDPKKCGY